jgi:hypothetical protein
MKAAHTLGLALPSRCDYVHIPVNRRMSPSELIAVIAGNSDFAGTLTEREEAPPPGALQCPFLRMEGQTTPLLLFRPWKSTPSGHEHQKPYTVKPKPRFPRSIGVDHCFGPLLTILLRARVVCFNVAAQARRREMLLHLDISHTALGEDFDAIGTAPEGLGLPSRPLEE